MQHLREFLAVTGRARKIAKGAPLATAERETPLPVDGPPAS
jgi:hypothetical protein